MCASQVARRVGGHTPRMETLLRNSSYILRFLSVLPCGEETEKQVFRGLHTPTPPTFPKSRDPEPLKGGPQGILCPASSSSKQGSEGLPPWSPGCPLPRGFTQCTASPRLTRERAPWFPHLDNGVSQFLSPQDSMKAR